MSKENLARLLSHHRLHKDVVVTGEPHVSTRIGSTTRDGLPGFVDLAGQSLDDLQAAMVHFADRVFILSAQHQQQLLDIMIADTIKAEEWAPIEGEAGLQGLLDSTIFQTSNSFLKRIWPMGNSFRLFWKHSCTKQSGSGGGQPDMVLVLATYNVDTRKWDEVIVAVFELKTGYALSTDEMRQLSDAVALPGPVRYVDGLLQGDYYDFSQSQQNVVEQVVAELDTRHVSYAGLTNYHGWQLYRTTANTAGENPDPLSSVTISSTIPMNSIAREEALYLSPLGMVLAVTFAALDGRGIIAQLDSLARSASGSSSDNADDNTSDDTMTEPGSHSSGGSSRGQSGDHDPQTGPEGSSFRQAAQIIPSHGQFEDTSLPSHSQTSSHETPTLSPPSSVGGSPSRDRAPPSVRDSVSAKAQPIVPVTAPLPTPQQSPRTPSRPDSKQSRSGTLTPGSPFRLSLALANPAVFAKNYHRLTRPDPSRILVGPLHISNDYEDNLVLAPFDTAVPLRSLKFDLISHRGYGGLWEAFSVRWRSAPESRPRHIIKLASLATFRKEIPPSRWSRTELSYGEARLAMFNEASLMMGELRDLQNNVVPRFWGLATDPEDINEVYAGVWEDAGVAIPRAERGELPVQEAILALYTALHSRGVVHGDVSWKHILAPPQGTFKIFNSVVPTPINTTRMRLVDFGLAKRRSANISPGSEDEADFAKLVAEEMVKVKSMLRRLED